MVPPRQPDETSASQPLATRRSPLRRPPKSVLEGSPARTGRGPVARRRSAVPVTGSDRGTTGQPAVSCPGLFVITSSDGVLRRPVESALMIRALSKPGSVVGQQAECGDRTGDGHGTDHPATVGIRPRAKLRRASAVSVREKAMRRPTAWRSRPAARPWPLGVAARVSVRSAQTRAAGRSPIHRPNALRVPRRSSALPTAKWLADVP
jgi:hypothetical protein